MNKFSNKYTTVLLNSVQLSNYKITYLTELLGDIKTLFELSVNDIQNIEVLTKNDVEKISKIFNSEYRERVNRIINKSEAKVVTEYDEQYPRCLINIENSPSVLYIMGEIKERDNISLSMVGSRKPTDYGIKITKKFASELAFMGITIISGMAVGIDSVAHRSAIESNGRTIAVLGSGIDVIHPKRNIELYRQIILNGAVISEYFFGTAPLPFRFPERNRIIAGLSLGTIVIEAKKQSGSLITAKNAALQGREIFAVPGNIDSFYSVGTNDLIKDGAIICTGVDDILDNVPVFKQLIEEQQKIEKIYDDLNSSEQMIIDMLRAGPLSVDIISRELNMNVSEINVLLTGLELKDYISSTRQGLITIL